MAKPVPLKVNDARLAEWLRSNPVGDPFSDKTAVIGLRDELGFRRWPIVPAACDGEG
jgi:hypothetical protein